MKEQPKVFLIHGFEGLPNGGWRPSLMGKLALENIYACALPMPAPHAPMRDAWVSEIRRAIGAPSGNVYLVGHSLGVPAILQYLQSLPDGAAIGGAVLVSGPYRNITGEKKTFLESFFSPPFDFPRIKAACRHFAVIHGDNDNVVPFSEAREYAEALSCELIPVPDGGHLNGSSGWRELPQGFDSLMSFLKS